MFHQLLSRVPGCERQFTMEVTGSRRPSRTSEAGVPGLIRDFDSCRSRSWGWGWRLLGLKTTIPRFWGICTFCYPELLVRGRYPLWPGHAVPKSNPHPATRNRELPVSRTQRPSALRRLSGQGARALGEGEGCCPLVHSLRPSRHKQGTSRAQAGRPRVESLLPLPRAAPSRPELGW